MRVLGPHSQLEEGMQEVLTAAQTSQSLVPGRTKAAVPWECVCHGLAPGVAAGSGAHGTAYSQSCPSRSPG